MPSLSNTLTLVLTVAYIPFSSAFTFAPTTAFSQKQSSALNMSEERRYTIPDQPARFARAKAENNERYLNIDSVYDPSYIKGKRVAITGANRGIGLALAKELVAQGGKLVALVRSTSDELEALKPDEIITGVEVTSDEACEAIASKIKGGPIDILVNNAGYFYEPVEKVTDRSLNFKEELKMIDICALGPLRVSANLFQNGLLKEGSVIAMITSQGGSISWRTVQNPTGGDYGHHMSKAAANMMSVLLSQEFKDKKIPVGILHPGFNKTEMTAKYAKIWEIEGAVDCSVGAKRVFHEIGKINMVTTGKFINCEDGLEIPW
jgi:NAD(P)-dependent dehydrogenase (short-subunit alcohol dehydrogenase family)